MRHAEATCNVSTMKDTDDFNSELTPRGVEQSNYAREWVHANGGTISFVFTSQLKRAKQTARNLNLGIQAIEHPLLNERILGVTERPVEHGRPIPLSKQFNILPKEYVYWHTATGESQWQILQKSVDFLLQTNIENNSLIVSHGYTIQALRCVLLGLDPKEEYFNFVSMRSNHVRNCQIYKITYFTSENEFTLIGEESYFLSDQNEWVSMNFIS